MELVWDPDSRSKLRPSVGESNQDKIICFEKVEEQQTQHQNAISIYLRCFVCLHPLKVYSWCGEMAQLFHLIDLQKQHLKGKKKHFCQHLGNT